MGLVQTQYTSTHDQLADMFTRHLSGIGTDNARDKVTLKECVDGQSVCLGDELQTLATRARHVSDSAVLEELEADDRDDCCSVSESVIREEFD